MTDPNPQPSDPVKPAGPIGLGFVLGVCILVFFFVLAAVMGLPTFVESTNIPLQ